MTASGFFEDLFQAQIYPMLLVDLDDFDEDDVADIDDVGDFVDSLFGELGDVDHAVLAGREVDAGAELTLVVFHDLDDLALVDIADFDVADDVLDDLAGLRDGVHVIGGDEDLPFVVDVDLDTGLVDDLVDGLAAAADDVADLVGIDGEGHDLGRPLAELLAGS